MWLYISRTQSTVDSELVATFSTHSLLLVETGTVIDVIKNTNDGFDIVASYQAAGPNSSVTMASFEKRSEAHQFMLRLANKLNALNADDMTSIPIP